jgi:hypothetical protein
MARMPFERKLERHICSDNAVGAHKIRLFVRLKTLAASAFLGYFFWLLKRSNQERIQVKNHQADAARDDGAQRAFSS